MEWDEELPKELQKRWKFFTNQLAEISPVPRCINPKTLSKFELHAFCDSSLKAYGACVYLKCFDENESTVNLVMSKSKVAPIKSMGIHRLELCSCLLAVELLQLAYESLEEDFESIFLWSDSQVAIAWIKTDPDRLQMFESNRVKNIKKQDISSKVNIQYVNTKQNPADLITRGCSTKALKDSDLWWHGPKFLEEHNYQMNAESKISEDEEIKSFQSGLKKEAVSLAVTTEIKFPNYDYLQSKLETLPRMQSVVAVMYRFYNNCKTALENKKLGKDTPFKTGNINAIELSEANKAIVKLVQNEVFQTEIRDLLNKGEVAVNSKFRSLSPIIQDGIIRVGGRLRHSNLPYDQKHPILLPSSHPFTTLIIRTYHERYLHVGQQGLLYIIRKMYWIVNAKSAIRKVIHRCITCFKVKPKETETYMGDLPACRVNPSFLPYTKTWLDYGGPFLIKSGTTRSAKMIKSWICLFICPDTKAIHIELVTDLTSASFIAALKRFVSRHGYCAEILSDNATTYIGARNQLQELRQLYNNENQGRIEEFCKIRGIDWKTIPSRASHFGGIWESAIKSIKYLLKRAIGHNNFTYEEMYTLLVEIEGILNSRPISPMSNDPNDCSALTPAHFTIGRDLLSVPEPDLTSYKMNRLTRWQRIEALKQQFWKRWYTDYITGLQQRSKWFKKKANLEIGMLALIKDENLPPTKWKLGRIIKLYPGADKIVRVVKLQTLKGKLKRSIHKICILPLESNDKSN